MACIEIGLFCRVKSLLLETCVIFESSCHLHTERTADEPYDESNFLDEARELFSKRAKLY